MREIEEGELEEAAGLRPPLAGDREGDRKLAMDGRQKDLARRMLRDLETTVGEVASTFGVSPAMIYRHVGAVRAVRDPA